MGTLRSSAIYADPPDDDFGDEDEYDDGSWEITWESARDEAMWDD